MQLPRIKKRKETTHGGLVHVHVHGGPFRMHLPKEKEFMPRNGRCKMSGVVFLVYMDHTLLL